MYKKPEYLQMIELDVRLSATEAQSGEGSGRGGSGGDGSKTVASDAEDRLIKAAKIRRFIDQCQDEEDAEEAQEIRAERLSKEGPTARSTVLAVSCSWASMSFSFYALIFFAAHFIAIAFSPHLSASASY